MRLLLFVVGRSRQSRGLSHIVTVNDRDILLALNRVYCRAISFLYCIFVMSLQRRDNDYIINEKVLQK